ncbi:RNA recognition motif 2-domain-containing protein [Aspergillus pseudoustus]|uniref:RNA recognition motif 2-domain-containing protein n=1 Tax=Aspergillus pseudoustus TaxID=1810923 RepID=A0ABR4IS87_9EURO
MRGTNSSRGLSSPSSTDGAASPNGSPDTKLTAFSPEDVRTKCLSRSTACGPLDGAGFRHFYTSSSDPFLVSTSVSTRPQLSPTAASFTPIGIADSASANRAHFMAKDLSTSNISFSAANSNADSSGSGVRPANHRLERPLPAYGAIGSDRITRDCLALSLVRGKPAEPEGYTRALLIENVPNNLTYMSLAAFFNRREFTSLKGPILSELSSMGKVYISFTDSREAKKAVEKMRLLRPEWRVFPLSPKEYVQHLDPALLAQTSDYEGQLLATVYYNSRNPGLNQHTVARSLETLAMTFGDIKTYTALLSGQENIAEFHIEYFNTRDAENVMITLNGTSVDDCVVEVSFFKPDVESETYPSPQSPCSAKGGGSVGGSCFDAPYQKDVPWTSPRHSCAPYMELSPTGRSTIPPGEHAGLMDWMTRAGENIIPSPRREVARYPDIRLSNQNAVDTERIRLGLDVRTTIMLRNIPNKIDQTMLKAIVDETSHGKYDFMYLRIDFANNCNVGYAFINLEDPIDIIDFVKARAGRTWNCFNSDKVAEVSYATIQGKDCLVQKFRNSSVMLEHPSFRPKIFHTGNGPLAGTEDRFPGPDNPSKMRRSIENAEHVGLFAPRVGQQYRDEQRRRRSQYDRGTTAAEREIVYVRTLAPRRPFGSASNGLKSAPCTYPAMKVWYDTIPDEGPNTS